MTIVKKTELRIEGNHTNGNCKPVFCITTGEVYASVTDAAKKNGVTVGAISYAIGDTTRSCQGKKFCLVTELMEHLHEISHSIITKNSKAIAYDAMIAEKERISKANAKLARHRETCEKLRKQMEAEMKALEEAEAEVRELGGINCEKI